MCRQWMSLPLLPEVVWPGESSESFFPVLTTKHLLSMVCSKVFLACVQLSCSMVVNHWPQTLLN